MMPDSANTASAAAQPLSPAGIHDETRIVQKFDLVQIVRVVDSVTAALAAILLGHGTIVRITRRHPPSNLGYAPVFGWRNGICQKAKIRTAE